MLWSLATWALQSGFVAHAEQADRNQPTYVESNEMHYDDLKQVNEFIGNVVLTKGTITLRADRLILRQDPEGYQHGYATGQLARFRQKRDGVDEWIEGEAEEVTYNGRHDTVELARRAQVRRVAGAQALDQIEGARIVYNSRSEQFHVAGQEPATAKSEPGRVRVIIQPRLRATTTQPDPAGGTALNLAPPSR